MGRSTGGRLAAVMLALGVLSVTLATTAGGAPSETAQSKIRLERKTIGVMGPVNAAEIIKLGTDATVAAARALGWRTIQVDPLGDPAKMASGMTSLVNSNVDAIVLTTIEPAVIASGLRAAKAKGIPVINTHTLTHSSPLFAGEYFLSPQRENRLLFQRMRRDLPRGSQIGLVELPQFLNAKIASDLMVAEARRRGWRIVARHDADLANLVGDTQRAVGDMIRANPGIDAIWGCCDFAPTGAAPAIRSSGRNIRVYALHGIPSAMASARSGRAVLEVAEYQKGGMIAMDELAAFFARKNPIAKRTPRQFAYKQTIVDRSNARRGYPYPTGPMLAQFKKRWARLYIPAS